MYAVEQYLFARSYMYAQVYYHKTVRAAEWMFVNVMKRFRELAETNAEPPGLEPVAELTRGKPLSVADYLWLDDGVVLSACDRFAGRAPGGKAADDRLLADLTDRLVSRRLFKTIELGDDPSIVPDIQAKALDIARRRFADAAEHYVHVDLASQVGYAPEGDEELWVVGHPRYGTVTLRRLLEDLPLGRRLSTVRLICAPELLDSLRAIVPPTP
jgi:HD superfamily phosphohydrolase